LFHRCGLNDYVDGIDKSQSLRKSGRLFHSQEEFNTLEEARKYGRNPFVNQVVCFEGNEEKNIKLTFESQSLRKSGRLFQIKTKGENIMSNETSQSLRKSGRLFRVFLEVSIVKLYMASQSLRKSGRLFQR